MPTSTAYSSLYGAFALGKQSAADSVSSTLNYLPTLSIGLEPHQIVNTLQPEIGGSTFLRGSYKGGFSGGGPVNFYPRGDTLGQFLMALTGSDQNPTGVAGQSGAYSHNFVPISTYSSDLPWYTLVKDVSHIWTNQLLNAKLDSLTLDIAKQQVVTASANWFATTPSEISVPVTETMDTSDTFVACNGSLTFLDELTSTPISTSLNASFERINVAFRNNLSQDQFVVGSLYPTGVTLLQRTAQVTLDVIIRDKLLYEAIYQNGGTSTMSSTIKRASLSIQLLSTRNIGATTQPWTITLTFPGLDLLMMPVSPSGAQLLRSTVTAQVTLGQSGTDTYSIGLISGVAAY